MSFFARFIILVSICSCMLVVALMHERLVERDSSIINGERPIVVVIPSYNNRKWYQLNLRTVFQQQYSNYRILYIDDCSQDGTYELVRQFVKASHQEERVTLFKNVERKGALYNLYHAIHSCADNVIIVTIDGDDWLKGTDVLQTINRVYADPNVWLTYGQFEEFPQGNLGFCHSIPNYVISTRGYRQCEWLASHLRTFYAGLFKKIKKEDLTYEGDFFKTTWDRAFMLPMLEMADGRIKFIDKIMYIYNQANPLNDFKINGRKQILCRNFIHRMPQYQPLSLEQASSFCVA